jgi:hypothetical protein
VLEGVIDEQDGYFFWILGDAGLEYEVDAQDIIGKVL